MLLFLTHRNVDAENKEIKAFNMTINTGEVAPELILPSALPDTPGTRLHCTLCSQKTIDNSTGNVSIARGPIINSWDVVDVEASM